MKVLHLSTFDLEGGAAIAASRLHNGLNESGVSSHELVMRKRSIDQSVESISNYLMQPVISRLRPRIDAVPLKFYKNKLDSPWNVGWLYSGLIKKIQALNPDVVHMHWVGAGFISIEEMGRLPKNWVWTMHDAWAFTGGCHVLGECMAFERECGYCPQLGGQKKDDLSNVGWQRRRNLYSKKTPVVIAPSQWMVDRIRASSLLRDSRIELIPNGLDTSIYRPLDKSASRLALGLSQKKYVVMFGALSAYSDKNKGYEKFKHALSVLKNKYSSSQIQLAVFGSDKIELARDFGFEVKLLGKLSTDKSLVCAYSAADVLCVPSLQESFGQVASEGMACGVPIVAFATSGLLDIVSHLATGYLAKPFDEVDFANGIDYILQSKSRAHALSVASRIRALEKFDIKIVTRSHQDLYDSLKIDSKIEFKMK